MRIAFCVDNFSVCFWGSSVNESERWFNNFIIKCLKIIYFKDFQFHTCCPVIHVQVFTELKNYSCVYKLKKIKCVERPVLNLIPFSARSKYCGKWLIKKLPKNSVISVITLSTCECSLFDATEFDFIAKFNLIDADLCKMRNWILPKLLEFQKLPRI